MLPGEREPDPPSVEGGERGFGLLFAALALLVALYPLRSGTGPNLYALAFAGFFFAGALAVPRLLRPLNRAWRRFGMALHAIVSPLMLALVFFGVVTPTALVMRLVRRRPLALELERASSSYWIKRRPPAPGSLKRPF